MGCSERQKEIRRRRKRRKTVNQLKDRVAKASASEKQEIVRKLRAITPGSGVLISAWKLEEA